MTMRTILFVFLLVSMLLFSALQSSAQPTQSQKYVIFRDDDVGPQRSIEALKAVNQVHIDENVPVTLAIIPHPDVNSTGNELLTEPLHSYLESIVTNPLFEFAQHGYRHKNTSLPPDSRIVSEFVGEPLEVQYNWLRQGQDDVRDAFGVTPTSFVPPWDHGDFTTLVALRALGFKEYCTGNTELPTLQGRVSGIRIESAAIDLDISGSYDALNKSVEGAKNITNQFLNDPNKDTLIVAYHWWGFSAPDGSADTRKVQLLRDYIDYLKDTGDVQFTRLDRGGSAGTESGGSEPAAVVASGLTYVSAAVTPYRLWFLGSAAVVYVLGFVWMVGPRTNARK